MKTPILTNTSIPVLLYHRIVNKTSKIGNHKIYVYEKEFLKQMKYLKENGFETITFHDILSNPNMDFSKKLVLTFDDGYEDNYTILFPILKQFNFKAVIYLVTQKNHNDWGVKEGEPQLNLMNSAQIHEMIDYGIEIGGHTRNHLALNSLPIQDCEKEILGCKQDIENKYQINVLSFAYPFGGLTEEIKLLIKKLGFVYAVSTNTGPDNILEDLMQIKRIEINPRTSLSSFKKKVSGTYFKFNFLQKIF